MKTVLIALFILFGFTNQTQAQRKSSSYDLAMCDIRNGEKVDFSTVTACDTVRIVDKESGVRIEGAQIISGTLIVNTIPGAGMIKSDGVLTNTCKSLINQSKGKGVKIEIKYQRENGVKAIESLTFTVK